MYWRGFVRKFAPCRRAASEVARIPWGLGAERQFGMTDMVDR